MSDVIGVTFGPGPKCPLVRQRPNHRSSPVTPSRSLGYAAAHLRVFAPSEPGPVRGESRSVSCHIPRLQPLLRPPWVGVWGLLSDMLLFRCGVFRVCESIVSSASGEFLGSLKPVSTLPVGSVWGLGSQYLLFPVGSVWGL